MANIRPSSKEHTFNPSSPQQGNASDFAKRINELTARPQLDSPVNAFIGEFPTNVLPERLSTLIETLNKKRSWLYNFTAVSILFVVSIIVGKRCFLKTGLGNFFGNLYIALVGPTGTGKSHPLKWATQYIKGKDAQEEERYKMACKDYERALKNKEQAIPPPKPKRFLVNNFTMEALHQILSYNRNGLGIAIDEIARIFSMPGRYTNTSDEDAYLSLFSGESIIIDRKMSESVIIREPFLSMCGTIQPEILKKLFKGVRSENGLINRFLFALCYSYTPLPWDLKIDSNKEFEQLDNDYNSFVEKLIRVVEPYNYNNSAVYTLSEEAIQTIELWQRNHEEDCKREPDHHTATFRKVQIYVLKFALLLQIIWDIYEGKENPEHKISLQTAIRAEILSDYFFETAKDIGGDVIKNTVSSKEKLFFDQLSSSFTMKEALAVGSAYGFKKSSCYAFIGRIKGILIEKVGDVFFKKNTPFKPPFPSSVS